MFGSVAGSCLPALQLDWECFRDLWLFRSEPQSLSRDLLAPGSWNIFQVRFCMWTRENQTGPAPQKIHSASWPLITFFPQPGPKWNSSVTFHCLNPKNMLPEPQKPSVTCVQKILCYQSPIFSLSLLPEPQAFLRRFPPLPPPHPPCSPGSAAPEITHNSQPKIEASWLEHSWAM